MMVYSMDRDTTIEKSTLPKEQKAFSKKSSFLPYQLCNDFFTYEIDVQ